MGAIDNLKTFMDVNEKGAAMAAQISALQNESKAAMDAAVASLDKAKTYVWMQSSAEPVLVANEKWNLMAAEVLTEEPEPAVAPAENVIQFQATDLPQDAPVPEPVPLAVMEPVPTPAGAPTPA